MRTNQGHINSTACYTETFPETKRLPHFAKEVGLLAFLIALVIILWCSLYDRWNLSLPVSIDVDSGYVLGMMRLAQNGDLGLIWHIKTQSFGAPFIGSLNDFPQTERFILWTGGMLARVIGLYPAANLMVIGLHLLAALSFYCAARLWKIRISVAWPLALVYAFSHQTVRSLPHLGIGYFGLLPLQLYVCWYIATSPRLSWKSSRFKLSLAIGLISGALSVYWIVFFLQIYGLAFLYRILKKRKHIYQSITPILLTGVTAAIFLGSFVAYQIENGRNPKAIVRGYRDTEVYSLKPIDLFIPRAGQAFGVGNLMYHKYIKGGAVVLGESETAYIGLLSIIGLILLYLKSLQRQISRKSFPLASLTILWVLAYFCFGGLNSLVSLLTDTYLIRSTNRYSTAISTIALLYFSFFFHRKSRKWTNLSRVCLIFILALLALLDQNCSTYSTTRKSNSTQLMALRVEADRELVTRLEQSLAPQSMLFMLPVVDFPESGLSYHFGDYEHFRLFYYSKTLRYSFGSNKGRPEADWPHGVAALPATEMLHALESYGFAGILLNRRGYEDGAGELLRELEAAGYPIAFEQGKGNEWVFIRLNPVTNPQLPDVTPTISRERRPAKDLPVAPPLRPQATGKRPMPAG